MKNVGQRVFAFSLILSLILPLSAIKISAQKTSKKPKDKLELKNLSNDPNYAKVVAEMKVLLAKMPTAK